MENGRWTDLVDQCRRLLRAGPFASGEDLVRASMIAELAADSSLDGLSEATIHAGLAEGKGAAAFVAVNAWLRARPGVAWREALVRLALGEHFLAGKAASAVLCSWPSDDVAAALGAALVDAPLEVAHNLLVPLLRHAPTATNVEHARRYATGAASEVSRRVVVRELWWLDDADGPLRLLQAQADPAIAGEATLGLALRGDEAALESFLRRMSIGEEGDRVDAIIDAAGLPSERTADALRPLLRDESFRIASISAWSCARVAARRSIPWLEEIAVGDDADRRAQATEALEWMNEAPWSLARDHSPAWSGGVASLATIVRWLTHSDSMTRKTAHRQLVFLTGQVRPFDGYAAWPTQLEPIVAWLDLVELESDEERDE